MKIKFTALLLAALSTQTMAQAVVLPETLSIGWLYSEDIFSQLSYCVPEITREKISDIQNSVKNGATVYYQKGAGKMPYILAMGDAFGCIERNGNGKPILPPKTFSKFIAFEGASEETTKSLYRSFSTQLATRGAAEALVKFSNGNALEVTLSVVEDAPFEIMYSTNFLKNGEYDETKYRFVIADQIKAFSTTTYGASGRRAVSILQNEITPRPLKGNHLQGRGTPQTSAYVFEGSYWRFRGGGSITLARGGELIFTPSNGETKTGSWQVDNGTLYFNYGTIYGSSTLDKDNNLFVEFRALPLSEGKSERRWTATLEQNRF